MFDLKRVMRTKYRIDDFQQSYFVLRSFDELLRTTQETDFAPLYKTLAGLPDIEIGAVVEGDDIVHRGTQTYPAARRHRACR
jgi:phenylalanine-4-hydroxylase